MSSSQRDATIAAVETDELLIWTITVLGSIIELAFGTENTSSSFSFM
jgi:hypothetical protein